eukprot:gene28319-31433_t
MRRSFVVTKAVSVIQLSDFVLMDSTPLSAQRAQGESDAEQAAMRLKKWAAISALWQVNLWADEEIMILTDADEAKWEAAGGQPKQVEAKCEAAGGCPRQVEAKCEAAGGQPKQEGAAKSSTTIIGTTDDNMTSTSIITVTMDAMPGTIRGMDSGSRRNNDSFAQE